MGFQCPVIARRRLIMCRRRRYRAGAGQHNHQFGLLFPSILSNMALMALVIRSLALLCSFLLALPGGWCCMIGVPCCDQRQPTEKRAVAPAPARPKSCCCHQPTEQKHNEPTPAPKPSTPVTGCSCDKAPAVAPEAARLGPDLFVAVLATPADSPLSDAGDQSDFCRVFDPPRSRLNVSHCVWLC
jgi:hypothetical protein